MSRRFHEVDKNFINRFEIGQLSIKPLFKILFDDTEAKKKEKKKEVDSE